MSENVSKPSMLPAPNYFQVSVQLIAWRDLCVGKFDKLP